LRSLIIDNNLGKCPDEAIRKQGKYRVTGNGTRVAGVKVRNSSWSNMDEVASAPADNAIQDNFRKADDQSSQRPVLLLAAADCEFNRCQIR